MCVCVCVCMCVRVVYRDDGGPQLLQVTPQGLHVFRVGGSDVHDKQLVTDLKVSPKPGGHTAAISPH